MVNMNVKIGSVELRNPVVLAGGTCGVMGEIKDAIDLSKLGAITTKSITKEPREGNSPIRIVDHHYGMMNAIGLANEGISSFIQEQAPKATSIPTTVIGSVAGHTIDEYVAVASAMDSVKGIELVEVNVSCPNTTDGLEFGACPKQLHALLQEVRPVLKNTGMIVKLSAAAGDLRPHAQTAIECGSDALTLINTIPGLAIDVHSRKPVLSRGIGGFSGGAIHPIAVRVVREIYKDITKGTSIPIIGTGGIMRWEDAAEFILAGASAVGIGTASYVNPAISIQVASKLQTWAEKHDCSAINELVGAMQC